MGRIDRLKAITTGSIEAFLASQKRPETVFPQLVREMVRAVAEVARAEAKALTAVAADRRRLDAANGRVSRLTKGAELAVKAGEHETARQAVAALIKAEHDAEHCRQSLARSESAYQSARDVRANLYRQLAALQEREQQILARVEFLRQDRASASFRQAASRDGTQDILEAVARMEMRVDQEESHLEVQDQIRQTLGATFQHERAIELENDAEVDRRLEELKGGLGHRDLDGPGRRA